ncbi:nucleoside-diphosphate kinase [Dactylosporangium sp. NPDC051484]|uniref:nucleoside-diphosphate kinase n=1 Tax=Dactylosporangium sp. NPDC051484 TaxID=3154942 RepID=UPI00344F75C6
MPRKVEYYRRESYFREALADATDIFGTSIDSVLHNAAFLMMKPDGLLAGKLNTVYSFVIEHGFSVVAVEYLTFSCHMWRELWRYQLTSATLDRLALKDALFLSQPSLALLLRSDGQHDLPGTVRLSELKGSANLKTQAAGTLRSQLRQPNRVFSLVHFADEPADLVRELGVLFPQDVRRRMLAALSSGKLADADRDTLREALARDGSSAKSFTLADAVDRVDAALDALVVSRPDHEPRIAGVRAVLDQATSGVVIDWRWLVRELSALDCRVDEWDLTVIGSYAIIADEPGEPKVIDNPDPMAWREPARLPVDTTAGQLA